MSVLVLTATGVAWTQYHDIESAIRRSGPLSSLATGSGEQNILVVGLDSRLDENGAPLPSALYAALDTGGADTGGHNGNVLMVLHLPASGGHASVVSVPRDDYVDLPGAPDGVTKGKIKQAYGLAYDQEHRRLTSSGVTDPVRLEQASRDAGRNAEIAAVSQFLAVPIDHIAEITMVAFYQIAQVVQPITVCLNEDTQDDYSGADFHKGDQQLNAAQAMAFVRQRRDYVHPQLNFTDLDRERRQQAFIASLVFQLKQAGTLTDPARLNGLLDVARENTAMDPGLDLLSLTQRATDLASGNTTFTTLPIDHFGKDPRGEDVNIVDPAVVRTTVQTLFAAAPPTTSASQPAPVRTNGQTVDVTNANGRPGLAAAADAVATAAGYPRGSTDNAPRRAHSTIGYPPGDQSGAEALAEVLHITSTTPEPATPAGHLHVVLGADFVAPPSRPTSPTAAAGAPAGSESSSSPGSSIVTGGIPCVK